jgi:GWxTD domain-containing protein
MQEKLSVGRAFIIMLSLVLTGLAGSANGGVISPLQGVGDVPFSADLPVFFAEDGFPRVHLTARVFERDLVRPKGGQPQRLALRMKLARSGLVAVDTSRTIEFVPRPFDAEMSESWTEPFRLIEIAAKVDPGTWAVTLDLSDERGRSSRASAVLEVPASRGARMSDPEFQLETASGKLPWPDRVYGLAQDTLEVYFEVEGVIAAGAESFRFEVHDPRYGLLDEQQLVIPLDSGSNAALWRLPVSDFPEGTYALKIVPPWEEDPRPSEFSVSWRIDRTLEGGDELMVEAQLALLPDDFDRFSRLSRARQIQLIDEFWALVDPTPGTDRNETRDLFRARIAEANRIYHSTRGPGALTDRGQVLVRLGRPQTIDTEVMPMNGDDLELAIQNLHDIYTPEVDGVMARGDIYAGNTSTGPNIQPRTLNLPGVSEAPSADFSSDTATDLRRNAARVGREGGFEVWKYEYVGRPLLDHHEPGLSENQHVRFIFVDRRGVGDYRLEFSNLSTRR